MTFAQQLESLPMKFPSLFLALSLSIDSVSLPLKISSFSSRPAISSLQVRFDSIISSDRVEVQAVGEYGISGS